jgi:hypothetical protein
MGRVWIHSFTLDRRPIGHSYFQDWLAAPKIQIYFRAQQLWLATQMPRNTPFVFVWLKIVVQGVQTAIPLS